MSTIPLAEKVVLVTGAAQGQGAAEARFLAESGAAVVLGDVQDEPGQKLANDLTALGLKATYVHLDVASQDDWQEAVSLSREKYGSLTGLINNAAISHRVNLMDIDMEAWQRILDINLTGAAIGIREVVPAMRVAGGGSIVNVSSVAGLVAWHASAYAVSKWGLRGLTKSAALEFGADGIRVNSIHPGMIETPFMDDAPAALRAAFRGTVPLGREGNVDDIAPLVGFLCSDFSAYITGAEIAVDGGFTAAGGSQGVTSLMVQATGESVKLLK